MRILFFSPDYVVRPTGPDVPIWGGSSYYRCRLPARHLAMHGYETGVTPVVIVHQETGYLTGLDDKGNAFPDPDVMVLHSWVQEADAKIRQAVDAGQTVIFDIDDLLWDLPPGHIAETLPADKKPEYARRNLLACSAVTVSTKGLHYWLHEHFADCPPIQPVPNAIDPRDFGTDDELNSQGIRHKLRTIGWSGNPLWRDDDLSLLRPWLGEYLELHKLKFVHVGAVPQASIAAQLGIRDDQLEQRPMLAFDDYYPSRPLRGIDLQLIPLVDSPFNRAKSNLKGLESAISGVPFLASPVGEYVGSHGLSHREMALAPAWRRNRIAYQRSWAYDRSIQSLWPNWPNAYARAGASS